jgi:hypothetical protein
MSRHTQGPALLDEEAWDAPDHLTDDDLHAAAGPDWRRRPAFHDPAEDEG